MSDDRDDEARQAAAQELASDILHTIARYVLRARRQHGETRPEAVVTVRLALAVAILRITAEADPGLPRVISAATLVL